MRLAALSIPALLLTAASSAAAQSIPTVPASHKLAPLFSGSHDSRNQTPALLAPAIPLAAYEAHPPNPTFSTFVLRQPVHPLTHPTCYAMRTYNFSPDDASGSPQPTGSYLCQLASNTHLKTITVRPAR